MSDSNLTIFFHKDVLNYKMPDGVFDSFPSSLLAHQIEQPENPTRIDNTQAVLRKSHISGRLIWKTPDPATNAQLEKFHDADYIRRLSEADAEGAEFSQSTILMPGEMRAVRLSAGSAIAAAREVIQEKCNLAYAISRPPSHHAQKHTADGYCFINGVALAVLEALENGYSRVAVIDWDVHHGNGTQDGFYSRDDVLTISLHMDHQGWGDTHQQSGGVDEIGASQGRGYNLNLPLPFGSGDYLYTQVFERCVVPNVRAFNPDLIVLANGQDANQFDPGGRQMLTMAGYYALASQLRELAQEVCDGKIVITQEGGYNPTYAPLCAYAVAAGLLNEPMQIDDPIAYYPDNKQRAERDLLELIQMHPLLN